MLSKELLNAVIGSDIQEFTIDNNMVRFVIMGDFDEWKEVNIYELVYKTKEWAFQQRYNMYSLGKWRDSNRAPYLSYSVTIKTFTEDLTSAMNKCYMDRFHGDSEPEAIFSAGEYIRKEITK